MKPIILIRFDDICPTMNFDEFKKATDLIDKYGVKPLIGVIPDCQDPDLMINAPHADFWNYIKQLQSKGYTVAMHGYKHVFGSKHHGIVENRKESEFAGHSYDVQYEKIKKGKELLSSHGIETNVFFAPAHSYDRNTLKALYQSGFKFISDGKSRMAYTIEGIKCLPCRAGGAAAIKGDGYYTSVFHAHEWTRAEKAYAFEELKATLEKYAPFVVSFEEYSHQPEGNLFIQQLDEKAYLIWQYGIKDSLAKLYHQLRKV